MIKTILIIEILLAIATIILSAKGIYIGALIVGVLFVIVWAVLILMIIAEIFIRAVG